MTPLLNAARRWVRPLMPRRLGRQLQWTLALSLALTLVVFGAFTIHQQTALALTNIENQAAALARSTALASVEPLVTDKLDVVEEMALHSASLPQVLDLAVFSAQGASLAHVERMRGGAVKAVYDPPGARAALPKQQQPHVEHDPGKGIVLAWHPMEAGSHLGWVRVAVDAEVLGAIRERIWLSTLAIGLAAGLASLALLSRLLARPMQALGQARDFAVSLERIEGQKLAQPPGPEETMALGRALNQASLRLFQQRQAIDDSFAALMRQELAVTEANEQLRTIFALSPDGLLSFDNQGHVRFANEAFFSMTGLQKQQVLEQPVAVVDQLLRALCAEPDDYPGLEALFRSGDGGLRGDAPARNAPELLRLALVRPRASVLEVVGRHGESVAVSRLLYLRDITHETEVERLKSEFLHTAAHELRTPMTAVHSCVELLRMREFEPQRRRDLLDIIHRHSLSLIHIVDELLDLARLEARSVGDFHFEAVSLADLVAQTVSDHVPPQGREAPELCLTSSPCTVYVDVHKFKQVVANLLSNAYKYSSQGAVQVRVLSETWPSGEESGPPGRRVGVEVQDHGIGMTAEQLAQVGDRFYRADASGHVLGSGLGMSIVKEMVGMMKGALEKASQPGVGSTFGVWFTPQEPAAASETAPGSAPVVVAADAPEAMTTRAAQEKSLHVADVQA